MKVVRFIILTAMVFLLLVTGNGIAAQSQMSETFGEVDAVSFTQEWASLVGHADTAGLEKILHENYMHIHGTALVENKAQFLEAFTSGVRRYEPIVLEELNVRIFGSVALASGRF